MNIDRINLTNQGVDNHQSVDRASEADKRGTGPNRAAGAKPSEDSIALSSKAQEIGRLSQLAAKGADRTERLNEIRAAIENGTYEVSGEKIALKMIAAHSK